jgi:hypothetical protein
LRHLRQSPGRIVARIAPHRCEPRWGRLCAIVE